MTIVEPKDIEEFEDTPLKKIKSSGLPMTKPSSKRVQIMETPKVRRSNSRRRITKILQEGQNTLSKVHEESNEESENLQEEYNGRLFKNNASIDDKFTITELENESEVPEVVNQISDKESEGLQGNKIQIISPDDIQSYQEDDSHMIEDEVQEIFKNKQPPPFELKRRHSSLSEGRVKIELLEDLLDEDDRDRELMFSKELSSDKISAKFNSSKDILKTPGLLNIVNASKALSDKEENKKLSMQEESERIRKSSVSNSSMHISDDSSSSLNANVFKEGHDVTSMHSEDSGYESDLLKEEEEKYTKKKRKNRLLQKSITQILPPLGSDDGSKIFDNKIGDFKKFDDIQIPLKKSVSGINATGLSKKNNGLDKLVKEFEDNDRLRDEMNKRHIMKKFNEIKTKTYNYNDYHREENEKTDHPNSDKKKYIMHVTESELKIIRKNRNLLLDLGAMLFWDHKYDNIRGDHAYFHHADSLNEKKIEFQISGNFTEVERAKEAIIFLLNYERKIEKEQVVVIEIDMWVPKILIRKVVGYHEKNLIEYYKKFDVSISYDSTLINDESYPIHEETMITIKGKKAFAEIVASDINDKISKLIVRTIHLAPSDCKYLKEKICQLKCRIDPAELRICRTTKQQKAINMNHPFFHIPAYYKEILVIGDKNEVYRAESEVYKFLREEKSNNQNIYTLSILIPFTIQPEEYNAYVDKIKEKYMVELQTYDAIPPRKHSTAMLVGTWENISLAKDMMVDWIESQRNMQMSRWSDYDKFDKMILNQQIRFTYKSLKRYIIEKHVKYLKHWDLTSHTVVRELPKEPLEHDKEKKAFYDMAMGETESLKFFMKQVDNETAVNVLFATNAPPEFGRLMDKYSLKKREIIEK